MPEPVTTSLTLGSAFLLCSSELARGVFGNRADFTAVTLYNKLREQFQRLDPDENHELQKAALRAFWLALLHTSAQYGSSIGEDLTAVDALPGPIRRTFEAFRNARSLRLTTISSATAEERQRVRELYRKLLDRVRAVETEDLSLQTQAGESLQQLAHLLEGDGGPLREALTARAIGELKRLQPDHAPAITGLIQQHWFYLYTGAFQQAVKDDSRISNILDAKLLGGLALRNEEGAQVDLPKFVDAVEPYLAECEQRIVAVVERESQATRDHVTTEIDRLGTALRRPPVQRRTPTREPCRDADLARYLEDLDGETAEIDIKGIQRAQKEATLLSIVDLYIPLSYKETHQDPGRSRRVGKTVMWEKAASESEANTPLEKSLVTTPARVLIVGDPGTGKSTFTRRLAFEACSALRKQPVADEKRMLPRETELPVYIRLGRLADYIAKRRDGTTEENALDPDSPEWLPRYLSTNYRLPLDCVEAKLEAGALVLADGLDEASESVRDDLVHLLERLPTAYKKSELVVTSRPSAFGGVTRLKGFQSVEIGPLTDDAIEQFSKTWGQCLHSTAKERKQTEGKLGRALQNPDMMVLARNPLMLTCLAVLCSTEVDLPDRRAELYDLILTWLAKNRRREGLERRPTAERCLQLHQQLALAMHLRDEGKQVEIPTWDGVKALAKAREFRGLSDEDDRIQAADTFLRDEEADSGIVKGEDQKLRFWHQHFQELLAAQALAGRGSERRRILFKEYKLHDPDWRETVVLLGGSLLKPSHGRLDDLLLEILEATGDRATLSEKARTLALIGAILRDVHTSGYEFHEEALEELVGEAMAIFEIDGAAQVEEALRADAADAIGLIGDRRFEDPEKNWVRVPEGQFWMGAQNERKEGPNYDSNAEDDETLHKVWLSAFEIGKYPVTVGEYERFLKAGGYSIEELWGAGGYGEHQQPMGWAEQVRYPSRPVVGVSWFEANAYALWIGARLPTEAEWEKAARCGRDGAVYPWGHEKPDGSRANFDSHLGDCSSVGAYPSGDTAKGLCDMGGNVFEWCSDWYDNAYYQSSFDRDPPGPLTGTRRVLRGGSWVFDAGVLRCAFRDYGEPVGGSNNFGFRCAREVPS